MEEKELLTLIKEITIKNIDKLNEPLHHIPIGVSNRHIHLSRNHLDRLFGTGYELTKWKDLSQPGQFAAKESVTLIGPKGKIEHVRILGPARGDTQVEVTLYDGFTLGVKPPIRTSGDIDGTPGITIQGPRGQLHIQKGLICAARHIHMHTEDAEKFGVVNGQFVQVKVHGERSLIFDKVQIRVSSKYRLEMHIDIDEANAGNIKNGDICILMK